MTYPAMRWCNDEGVTLKCKHCACGAGMRKEGGGCIARQIPFDSLKWGWDCCECRYQNVCVFFLIVVLFVFKGIDWISTFKNSKQIHRRLTKEMRWLQLFFFFFFFLQIMKRSCPGKPGNTVACMADCPLSPNYNGFEGYCSYGKCCYYAQVPCHGFSF